MTLVFDDGKWVEAHKMILAASICLRLAENSKNKHPQSAPTDIFEKNSEQYSKQSVLSIFERLLTAILSKFCSLLFTLLAVSGAVWITLIQLLACSSKHVKPFGQTGI